MPGACFTCEVSRMYFGSEISSLLKTMMFLLKFATANVACGVLSLCFWFSVVRGTSGTERVSAEGALARGTGWELLIR